MTLDELSEAAGEADEAYAVAVGTAGEAVADYEYAFWVWHAQCSDGASDAARRSAAEAKALDEKVRKVRAEAAEKRCKKHVDVLLARLSAEQTKVRFEGGLS